MKIFFLIIKINLLYKSQIIFVIFFFFNLFRLFFVGLFGLKKKQNKK